MIMHCRDESLNPAACFQSLNQLTQNLGASWYYVWFTYHRWNTEFGSNIRFVPMVRDHGSNADYSYTTTELNNVKTFARNNPGSYWLIFNEPDFRGGSTTLPSYIPTPDDAARIYKPLSDAIKSVDPNAKLIVGGMLYHNSWIGWAQAFIDAYRNRFQTTPQIEGWHVHQYMCGDYTKNSFRDNLINFRSWINTHSSGELWLTEFGCLSYDYPQIIIDQLDWMENYPGIQRYAWYVAASKEAVAPHNGGTLLRGTGNTELTLTPLGITYSQYPTNSLPTAFPTPTPLPTPTPTPTLPSTPTPTTPVTTPSPSSTPHEDQINTQKGWNLITSNYYESNIFQNCSVSSKRNSFWKIIKTQPESTRKFYAKCP